jgi:hypothetical protein
MNNKTLKITGNMINYLIGGILILSGFLKLIGLEDYLNVIKELNPNFLSQIYIIALVEMLAGALFIIPRLFAYGYAFTLVFFGGTIAAHMQHGDPIFVQIIFVLLTIAVAHIKKTEWFSCKK